MRFAILLAAAICCSVFSTCAQGRVLLKVQPPAPGSNLLRDEGWKPDARGFVRDESVRRSGKPAMLCQNTSPDMLSGANQTIVLNQKAPRAIRAVAWSKAEGVGPVAGWDYSLYLDIQYTDGVWVWGQVSSFDSGTHDWQAAEVVFYPEKPIKLVSVNLLLRRTTGKAWFADASLEEIGAKNGVSLFDGVAVSVPKLRATRPALRLATADGLQVTLAEDGSLAGGKFGAARLASGGGFYLRDVAAESDFMALDAVKVTGKTILGECNALGLRLKATTSEKPGLIRFDCEATETTGKDRAVTIGFAIPMPSTEKRWWHSIRSSDRISSEGDYADAVPSEAGLGWMSKYPFACISTGHDSLNLGIPMDEPCVYRIAYSGALGWYTISFDLGYAPSEGVKSHKFSFVLFRSDGVYGMRAAMKKYYDLFPEFFVKRVDHEGNWMAFLPVSRVQGWEDFAFAFHEGSNDIAWDAEHGIYSFRYTEPMSYWMPMPKETPRTVEAALSMVAANLKQSDDQAKREWASATILSLAKDDYGKDRVFLLNAPWCDGAMFLLNPCPRIPVTPECPFTKATLSWNPALKDKLYGDKTKPQLAGEYLDSVEMGCEYVNTRREHFRYAIRPLSFSRRTKRPAILQILSTYEFARWMADDIHKMGKLMMANTIPTRYGFFTHLIDVNGIETNWLQDGKYSPPTDQTMDFRRAMCYQKPYCYIMNTDYEAFDTPLVEKYFQRCMFWGIWPGFFSPNAATGLYFEQPKYYERDRHLFKKYMPVIKRITTAGWEPLTMATTSNRHVEAERFGPGKDGSLYFTVRNTGKTRVQCTIRLDAKLGKVTSATRLPGDGPLAITLSGGIKLTLDPDEVSVVEVRTNEQARPEQRRASGESRP